MYNETDNDNSSNVVNADRDTNDDNDNANHSNTYVNSLRGSLCRSRTQRSSWNSFDSFMLIRGCLVVLWFDCRVYYCWLLVYYVGCLWCSS